MLARSGWHDEEMEPRDAEFFLALEERVWQAQVSGDAAAEREVLPEDFLGVDTGGFNDLERHLAQLADGPITAQYALSEARLLRLGEDAALLSYRADARSPGAEVEEVFYISSLWQRRDGRWWNTFSQDTPGPALTAEEGALRHGPPSALDRSADASPR